MKSFLAICLQNMQVILLRSTNLQYKNSDHPQFTENPFAELKNFAKGHKLEEVYSKKIHKEKIPILVSSKILRNYHCGQVDLATYWQGQIIVYEVKNQNSHLTWKQHNRLHKSLKLLTNIFDSEGYLKILKSLPKD